jgi:hypothetical protein
MKYDHGELVGGKFTNGTQPRWDWTRHGGSYGQNRDFFSVHWEVQERDPSSIRLHVEAPDESADATLNQIKQQVVQALLASDIETIAKQNGFVYRPGSQISSKAMSRNKSTEAFRIVLDSAQRKPTSEEDIATVHEVFDFYVSQILDPFQEHLRQQFPLIL